MNSLKKAFVLAAAAVACMSLTACKNNDVVGNDWRVTGIVRDGGTITRSGEETTVLVCVNKKATNFYYNSETQTLFDSVSYPTELEEKIALSGDVWEMFKGIDFADLNGDGNSDVTMRFDDSGSEIRAVWLWDAENGQFTYQQSEQTTG